MKHVRATHPTDLDCGPYGCNVCNLFVCELCGGAEGSLTTDCPCYKIPYVMDQLVYAGAIDFVVDQWATKNTGIEITIVDKSKRIERADAASEKETFNA